MPTVLPALAVNMKLEDRRHCQVGQDAADVHNLILLSSVAEQHVHAYQVESVTGYEPVQLLFS